MSMAKVLRTMQRFHFATVLLFGPMLLLSACAHDDLASDTTGQSTATVPGEKVSGEGMTPGAGPGGASANVKW